MTLERWATRNIPQGSEVSRGRSIPFNDGIELALREALSFKHVETGSEFVFCNKDGRPYARVTTSFKNVLRRAKLEGRGFTFHSLRHSYASRLAILGVSTRMIADLLGHHSERMTWRYAHLSPDSRRAAVEKLNVFGTRVAPASKK